MGEAEFTPNADDCQRSFETDRDELARLDRFDDRGSINDDAVVHDLPNASRVSNI